MTRPGFLSIDRIVHRAALAGQVVDQAAQAPLAGVEVSIKAGPAAWAARVAALLQGRPSTRPGVCVTDAGGFFRWLDLPPGDYTLSAALPGTRYSAANAVATLVASSPTFASLGLAPTRITGLVNAGAPAVPLSMVRVRLADSGELTYTAADGTFSLAAVEAGTNRALELSAQNYVLKTQVVTLQQGLTTAVPTITLSHI